MGDSCCSSFSVGSLKKLIEDKLGVYVLSVATGSSAVTDVLSSYFGDVNEQVANVCEALRTSMQLRRGYNAVGFSQGSQFLRAVVQRCNHVGPRAHTLVSIGGQHQGVMSLPGCSPEDGLPCAAMQALASRGAYLPFVQSRVVQAQYFKDPWNLDAYLTHGVFLPDINNERDNKSKQYAANLASLERFVMFQFHDDDMVVPRDSSWFGFYNGTALVPLEQQRLYTEDWIGLRKLDESGRLVRASIEGRHMHFSQEWFEEQVLWKYLARQGFRQRLPAAA